MLGQLILSGISQGAIYALVALGMTVLYRTTAVLNFGYGDTFMLGAFVFYVFLKIAQMPFGVAALLAVAVMIGVGLVIERLLIRPIAARPHLLIAMMTIAISYLFRGATRMIWGRDVQPMPSLFDFPPVFIGDMVLTSQSLVIMVAAAVLVIVFFSFFNYSALGKLMQAASHSPRGAALIGINVPLFSACMWGLSVAIAAVAGILVAPVTLLYPDMGAATLLKAFAAMTLGGFGNLGGAVLGGVVLGISEQLCGGYISTSFMDIFPYLVILVVLLVYPAGMLGRSEITRV
jgi:branched-chain amino acid transport system permease protein